MKSDIFDFSRFARYLRTDMKNASRNWGLSMLVASSFSLIFDVASGLIRLVSTGEWSGAPAGMRMFFFVIASLVCLLAAPSKLYGNLTDRKEGAAFLMLPVSALEKYISMICITCVIVPVIYLILFLSIDCLVSWIDPTAGESLILMLNQFDFHWFESHGLVNGTTALNHYMTSPDKLLNPLLNIDDILIWPLAMLLGAITFKKSKVAKTLGVYIIFVLVLSLILIPTVGNSLMEMTLSVENLNMSFEIFKEQFPGAYWFINHLVLVDTVIDQIFVIGLLVAIWFRLKGMKH